MVILEVVKALCRVGMGRASGGRMVVGTGVGDERVERNGDAMGEEGVEVDGGGKGGSGEWKMPRTGGRLPALPTSSSTVASSSLYTGIEGVGGAGKETIAAFLSSRVLTPDDIKSAHRLVRTLHSLPALLAESLYILRPVLYALALQRCHPDKKDWRPWLLGLGMELAARQLRIGDAEGGLSEVEREEGKRRGLGLLWWGMRGAFYENATRGVVRGVVGRLKGRAVLDMVGVVLEDYDVLWGEYYFPTATL